LLLFVFFQFFLGMGLIDRKNSISLLFFTLIFVVVVVCVLVVVWFVFGFFCFVFVIGRNR